MVSEVYTLLGEIVTAPNALGVGEPATYVLDNAVKEVIAEVEAVNISSTRSPAGASTLTRAAVEAETAEEGLTT